MGVRNLPDINEELLALIGRAPQPPAQEPVGLPDLDPSVFMSQAARQELFAAQEDVPHTSVIRTAEESSGMDAFLAPSETVGAAPLPDQPLAGIWGGIEREAGESPSGGLETDLSALFMGGREAQAAAEAQGLNFGDDFPVLAPPPADVTAEDITFDTLDDGWEGGGGATAPNPAVRWTVGRESPPPAAPPMSSHRAMGGNDGRVVSSLENGRFVSQVQQSPRPAAPRPASPAMRPRMTHEATRPAPAPAPRPFPTTAQVSIYDHILSED